MEWIEVSVSDVTKVLCPAATDDLAQPAPLRSARTRSRPTRERAMWALNQLYANGVPAQADVPNSQLCRKVGEKLRENGLPDVKDDTILRAAGRRR